MVVLFSAALSLAQAGTITTTDSPTGRATFGGNDTIDWSTLGADFTDIDNPFTINSANGVVTTVSESSGGFELRDQPAGWNGNFSDNLNLLWTDEGNGPITMVFSTPIQGIGFQINPDDSDTAAQFQVFGAGDVLFGTFPLTTLDRSAPAADFIGVTSSAADIVEIVISLGPTEDFTINEASLIDGGVSTTPEPGGVILVASGLALLLAGSQRARKLIRARG
jgi:hypothetical protein